MRFSAPVKKHWLGSFSVLPPSGLRGFVPVVAGRRGRVPGGRGGGIPWGGGGVAARGPRPEIHMYV